MKLGNRTIVRIKGGFGMSETQREKIQAHLSKWFESGTNPLVVGDDFEVMTIDGPWEHLVEVSENLAGMEIIISAHERGEWQVAAMAQLSDCLCVVFKRRVGYSSSDSSSD